jgi:hypothetical protein
LCLPGEEESQPLLEKLKTLGRDKKAEAFQSHLKRLQIELEPREITVGGVVGFGSSSRVKRGTFGNTNVAIKTRILAGNESLHSPSSPFSHGTSSLENEVAILLVVRHPNVVEFFGVVWLLDGW